jgi:membrane associated rhomboid family serine protease
MFCVRHPNRPTALRCSRCERPACPECLREAAVGLQCVDCVAAAGRAVRVPTTVAGAPAVRRAPVVTQALIAVNVLVYLVTAVQAGNVLNNQRAPLFVSWQLWPPAVYGDGDWWRLVTSGFLHFGPVHLGLNMFALWILGRDLESALGRARYTGVYLLSLFGGGVSVYLFGQLSSGVAGASGAVFGLMGGLLVVLLRLKRSPAPALGVIVLNLVFSVTVPGISLLGHLGGLVVGGLVTAALVYAPRDRRVAWQVGAGVAALVVLVGLVLLRDAQLADQLTCDHLTGPLRCYLRQPG